MNVIISNQQDSILSGLNIEIIKSLQGEFEVDDLINSFSNFFFSRMIIDVTAIRDYEDIINYQKLSIGLPVDKIILLIPAQTNLASNNFLSKLISMGYYNFTTNLEGIEYLLEHPNSYKDVAHIHQIEEPIMAPGMSGGTLNNNSRFILGIKNVTDSAGATTLTYLMYKILSSDYGIDTLAIEVNKRDFVFFNDNKLVSVNKSDLANTLLKNQNHTVILVDLNDQEPDICTDCIYLVEPSIIKMNKLMRKDRNIFNKLRGKKIVLNKSCLSSKDIKEFESEANSKFFYVLNPVDDRRTSNQVLELLSKFGIISYNSKN